jgi:hypothetical protein
MTQHLSAQSNLSGEMTDFFQKQAQECRRLAAQATGKNDREYWLRLAQRWEWLTRIIPAI